MYHEEADEVEEYNNSDEFDQIVLSWTGTQAEEERKDEEEEQFFDCLETLEVEEVFFDCQETKEAEIQVDEVVVLEGQNIIEIRYPEGSQLDGDVYD